MSVIITDFMLIFYTSFEWEPSLLMDTYINFLNHSTNFLKNLEEKKPEAK